MMKNNRKTERTISMINDGTVIDHLDPTTVFEIVSLLNLDDCHDQITIGINMKSNKIGRKGMIKIENHYLSKKDVDKISLFSPHATISLIKDYEIKEKFQVEIPKCIENVLKCNNPNCITNIEGERTSFSLYREEPLELRCKFCERHLLKKDLEVFKED